MCRIVEGFTGLYRAYTLLYRGLQGCIGYTGLNKGLQGFIGVYRAV